MSPEVWDSGTRDEGRSFGSRKIPRWEWNNQAYGILMEFRNSLHTSVHKSVLKPRSASGPAKGYTIHGGLDIVNVI